MFLIIFVKPDCKEIGVAGGYRIMETCERLYLFFIPTFGWNRQYFAVAQDGTARPIREEAAKAVKHGEKQVLLRKILPILRARPPCHTTMVPEMTERPPIPAEAASSILTSRVYTGKNVLTAVSPPQKILHTVRNVPKSWKRYNKGERVWPS